MGSPSAASSKPAALSLPSGPYPSSRSLEGAANVVFSSIIFLSASRSNSSISCRRFSSNSACLFCFFFSFFFLFLDIFPIYMSRKCHRSVCLLGKHYTRGPAPAAQQTRTSPVSSGLIREHQMPRHDSHVVLGVTVKPEKTSLTSSNGATSRPCPQRDTRLLSQKSVSVQL